MHPFSACEFNTQKVHNRWEQGSNLTLLALVGMLQLHAAQRVVLVSVGGSSERAQVGREPAEPRSLLAPAVDELAALMARVRIDATTDW